MKSTRRLFAICISLAILSAIIVGLQIRTATANANHPSEPVLALLDNEPDAGKVETARFTGHQAQQGAPAEPTIGENKRHTNIQLLKDYPDSQLIPMMNLINASLGVQCNFCHVFKEGRLEPALDDKPEKKTAREMITMTLAINKANFNGRSEVSCFTCHRGRNNPVGVPALPLPEPAPRQGRGPGGGQGGQAPGGGATATAPQVTADDVLNKYVAALGGQAAIDKLKTRVMKGTYTTGPNTINLEIDQSGADKIHVVFVSPQGTMERAVNGNAGWEKNPRGLSDLGGAQLAELKTNFALFRDLRLKEQFSRMTVRKEKLDGKDVNVIAGASQGGKRERLYFDAETGLLLRRISLLQTPIGVVPEQVDYEDYRDVDGVKIPFLVKTAGVDGFWTGTRKFTEIKINTALDDAAFNKPAAAAPTPAKP
jgi:hypothetical protein